MLGLLSMEEESSTLLISGLISVIGLLPITTFHAPDPSSCIFSVLRLHLWQQAAPVTYGIGHGIMALLRIWTVCFCLTPWSTLDSGKEVGAPAVRIRGLPQGVGDCSSISPLILGLPIQRLWAHSDVACLRQHQEWVMAPWPEKQKRDCREWLQQRQCQLPGCRSCLPGAGGWEEPSHSHHQPPRFLGEASAGWWLLHARVSCPCELLSELCTGLVVTAGCWLCCTLLGTELAYLAFPLPAAKEGFRSPAKLWG